MYKVVKTGSTGNAVLYHNSILVDCGVPYALIKPYLYDIDIVLLTHEHKDHFNIKTIEKLIFERPALRIACCEWIVNLLPKCKNIDVFEIGCEYDYGTFKISPIKLYHDVPNCGYRILTENYKIIHVTDSAHLEGITAPSYNLYAIESNYDEETIHEIIESKQANGDFSYEKGAINNHLSEQQANDFVYKNKGINYEVLRLHESTRYATLQHSNKTRCL
jgi:phosphoribosyl 1,2-cyclic phosphodiesterase